MASTPIGIPLGASQPFGPFPQGPLSRGWWSAGPSPAALVFPLAKAQPGAADEGGASPGGRTAAVLGWAGLGWERPGRLHCSSATSSPSSPLHQQPWSLPGSGGLRGDHRWWMGKH